MRFVEEVLWGEYRLNVRVAVGWVKTHEVSK